MTIRARLWIGIGLMMAAVVGLATLGLGALVVIDREYTFLLEVHHQQVAWALRLKTASQAEILAARSYVLTDDRSFLEAVEQADAEQATALERLRRLSDDSAPMLDEIERRARAYDLASGDDAAELGRQADGEHLELGGERARRELVGLIDEYVADRQAALDASSDDVTRVVLGVALTLAVGAVVATATAAVTAWKTSRAILFPLSGLVTATRALQSGRSDLPLPPSSADEIGELGRAFGEMRRAVAEREAALASERARAESILRSLAEGLCLLDDDLRIVYVNPSLGGLLGWLPNDLIGRHILDVIAELSTAVVAPERVQRPILRSIRRADRRLPPIDIDFIDGHCLRMTTFLVRGVDGVRTGRGLLIRDVTAERERERLHTTFLKLISHELRTPLGAIKGFTSALRQDDLPLDVDTRREFLDGIEDGADQLAQIVSEILDLSRIEAGAVQLQKEPCSPRALLDSTIGDLGAHLGADTRIRLAVPRRLPLLTVDPILTRQALRGILDNALRYSPGGSTVLVTASLEGQRLVLRIADNGAGLTESERQRVFEPFYRAGRSDTRGLGLGLAICRGLIRAQGGSIAIESVLGQGTTVSVGLPTSAVPALVGSGR
jgi:NtrC-family two-component system sensor histidine kinase KinB